MSRRNNGERRRGEINKLDIMRKEMERMRKEEEMQKEEMERMQRGVTFTIGQDGPLDLVARRGNVQPFVPRMSFQDYVNSANAQNVQPFVPPMTLQDYEDSEKEKADSLEFLARRNSRNDEAARRKIQNDLLEDSFQNYDMSGFEGGARGARKKKYTQTRQKKQHRRHRRRRHSTRKHKK
jgi:hypothetical protein